MNTHDKLKLAAEIGVTLPHYTNTDNPIDFPYKGADRTKELARKAGLSAPYGDAEGRYTGDGWCRLHKEKRDPGSDCEEYVCFQLLNPEGVEPKHERKN